MREPLRPRARLIRMTRALALPLVALVLLAGCGTAERAGGDEAGTASKETASASPSPTPDSGCTAPTGSGRGATDLATLDLDGDGRPDVVGLTSGTDPCPGQLWATVGDREVFLELPTDGPPVRSAFAVTVPGRAGQLLVTRQDHPRGGFQTRVFAFADDQLAQLEVEEQPLVPFVATDVQEHPVSIDCGDDGILVTEAVAHEPAGVMFAWDIRQTTYTLDGTTVTAGPTEEIADNVLPTQLRQEHPELVKNAVFPSCRVPG